MLKLLVAIIAAAVHTNVQVPRVSGRRKRPARSGRHLHSRRGALRASLLISLFASVGMAHADDTPSSALDLQFGEVLFHYYQDDWFNSIVRTEIAQTQQRLPHHAEEAELMRGGLSLNYGLRSQAESIFNELLADSHVDTHTRNRAWYYLARISWQRNDPSRALRALAGIGGDMTPGVRTESAQLASLVLLDAGANDKAIEVLEDARSHRAWSPYLAYNLGVAQVRSGRYDAGYQTLASIGKLSARSEEYRLLRDKANLALGYTLLQNGNMPASRSALERVRLNGPLSGKALLGAGWADAETEDYRRALTPWLELSERDPTDPAVQEALLAVPYAMTKLELHGRAVQQYDASISALIHELGNLDESIDAIRRGELLDMVRQQHSRKGSGWMQDFTISTRNPALRYQVQLLASHDFQEAVKSYRDLLKLDDNLRNWSQAIEAYDDMLAGREQRFSRNRPAAEAALEADTRAGLQARLRHLSGELEHIEANRDAVGLAKASENRHWQQLLAIGERLERLPQDAGTSELAERFKRLRGVLYWQLQSEYKPRLWEARKQLREITALLEHSGERLRSLAEANASTPTGFDDFAQRIRRHRQRIHELLARTETLHLAQGRQIEQIAISELQQQKARLDTYIVQARFTLAQTYDNALVAGRGAVE